MQKRLVSVQAKLAPLRHLELHAAFAVLVAIALALCVIAVGSLRGQSTDIAVDDDLINALGNCVDTNSASIPMLLDRLTDVEESLTKQEANTDAALRANATILQSLDRVEQLIKSRRGITM